jgi:nicotinamide mononucleotide transporter
MDRLLQSLQPLLATAFELWGSPVTWAEMLAFVLSLAMVACNVRVNATAWPLAIAASLLYFLLFWNSRLYGEAGLQVFFALLAGWGWWQWLRGQASDGSALRVRRMAGRGRLALIAAVIAAWPLLGAFLRHFTDTDVPWWDAWPTVGSVAGQWLLGRKYVENWPVWVVVNLVSMGLFAWKGLWLTMLLYALFALMALWGWRAWHRLARTGAAR